MPRITASWWVHLDQPQVQRRSLYLEPAGIRVEDPTLHPAATRRHPAWFVLDRHTVVGGTVHTDGRFDLWLDSGYRVLLDPSGWREPRRVADHLWACFGDLLSWRDGPHPFEPDRRRRRLTRWPLRAAIGLLAIVGLLLALLGVVLLAGAAGSPGLLVPGIVLPLFGAAVLTLAWRILADGRALRAWDRQLGVLPRERSARYAADRRPGSDA